MSTTGWEKNSLHLSNFALRTLATNNTLTLSPSRTCQTDSVNSPMSNLVLNLSGLSTGRGTPRRKLSLSGVDTPNTSGNPTPDHSDSTESVCQYFFFSPSPPRWFLSIFYIINTGHHV
ncbi:hypothetical protein ACJMK2_006210 [Sinanodonta woodiana]|uniref:Uncharacterized protein n=1 Tax=Sinanodonta woodiana TaxID=1069815 RepID=A0ABD3VTT5_SINWO